MDGMKNQVLTEKTIRLLRNNQYTFNVDSRMNKTDTKNWIEAFFNVKVKSINSNRFKKNRQRGQFPKIFLNSKRMIITLRSGYSIPLFPGE
uniref:Ribosomal protein L23 n=1 Tax=Mankyua chejuensis TaxID=996148 RepID=H8Y657_9MONI|nr:ribosomal protein L23 [Mankyua chejuensis]ADZ48025.1 ribosomal protein L23 [Mankyua chejuensis]AJJ48656.1 ribosomal protein L23 [Mankyua chejuensis]